MAAQFDGPQACDDSDFLTIRFRDTVPDNHPVRFINTFIDTIPVTSFEKSYKVGVGKKGRAPKDVRLMLKIILYAIYCRIYSAHKIDYATEHYADFWFFSHAKRISHDKISDFISMHGDDLHTVFLETISLAQQNDLLSFDALYQDGFKVKANASKNKNYTQKRLDKKEAVLSENLSQVIDKLKETQEDDNLRKEKKAIQYKLQQIGNLRDELLKRIDKRSENKSKGKKKKIAEKTCINATDSDAELMKQKDKSHANSYLKITGTDNKADIVISSTISGHDHEAPLSLPLFDQSNSNLLEIDSSELYDTAIADSGFTTLANCDAFEQNGAQIVGPTQAYEKKQRHGEKKESTITFEYDKESDILQCSEGAILPKMRTTTLGGVPVSIYGSKETCLNCTCKDKCTKDKSGFRRVMIDHRFPAQQRTLEQYSSELGQSLYKKRSHVAETYQGDLKQNGRFTHYMLRGIQKVTIESTMHDIVWNIRRIFTETIGKRIAWST